MTKRTNLNMITMLLIVLLLFVVVSKAPAYDLESLMKIRPGRARAITSTDTSFNGNSDRIKYVTPGETKVLADIKGPGVIRHIWQIGRAHV